MLTLALFRVGILKWEWYQCLLIEESWHIHYQISFIHSKDWNVSLNYVQLIFHEILKRDWKCVLFKSYNKIYKYIAIYILYKHEEKDGRIHNVLSHLFWNEEQSWKQ